MNGLLTGLVLAGWLATGLPSFAAARPLTDTEAGQLVMEAIRSQDPGADRLPGFEIYPFPDPFFPGFTTFHARWRGVKDGGSSIDYIDVNMRNADVMEAMICQAITGAGVKRLQRRLRREMGLSRTDVLRLRRKGPYCEGAVVGWPAQPGRQPAGASSAVIWAMPAAPRAATRSATAASRAAGSRPRITRLEP